VAKALYGQDEAADRWAKVGTKNWTAALAEFDEGAGRHGGPLTGSPQLLQYLERNRHRMRYSNFMPRPLYFFGVLEAGCKWLLGHD